MAVGLDPFWRPDIVHAHDWHAGARSGISGGARPSGEIGLYGA